MTGNGNMTELRKKIKRSWELLHHDIFVGDMRDQNMRACLFVGIAVAMVASTTTTLNFLSNKDIITTLTTIIQAIGGIVIVIFILRDEKKIPTISMMLICIITFSYYAFSGATGGSAIIWTLLAPLGIGYFGNALYGIYCGVYFEVLLIAIFYTPVRYYLSDHYTRFFMDRFPIIYLFNLILVSICLINYHLSALKLMESAKELLKSKEEADRANRGKSDFLSNMSHEIRTPINAVLGMNEMILRESLEAVKNLPKDDEAVMQIFSAISKYSGNIESAGNNLLSLINDILDFSKIESGKMQLVEANYNLSSVLNDVSNMIFFKAKEKGLTFSVDVDRTIPDVLNGDEIRVRQIMINILNNAVKYTKEGHVDLTVRSQEYDSYEKRAICLIVSVSDTGIGIKQEDIGKLFTKFERVDLEQNSTVEGTGLGLAITKNLLEMMGGDIEVKSVYNEGSTFIIRLPQVVVSDEPVGDFKKKFDESIATKEIYVESFHAPDAHILVVDDTKMNLLVVEGLLKNTGLKIDTATSGARSIELARKTKYDIILMDQRMPGMNGTEALHIIKKENTINKDTPFICLTADAISGAKERYMASGFEDYLTKPIDYAALEKMLINYLPKEKVLLNRSTSADKEAKATVLPAEYDLLKENGIDSSIGLKYCNNDWDFYKSILNDFVISYKQRSEKLEKLYEEKNWHDYATIVHSLKSASKTIGDMKLSEIAKALEKAADESDADFISGNHDQMIQMYCDTVGSIMTVFDDLSSESVEDDDILEFEPDPD